MKPFIKTLLCFFAGLSFVSCQSDEIESGDAVTPSDTEPTNDTDQTAGLYISLVGTLLDGGRVSGISLKCLPTYHDDSETGQDWWTYYPNIKTINSYLNLYLKIDNNGSRYRTDNLDEMDAISDIESEYYKEKSSFIKDEYYAYELLNKKDAQWPELYTAYVNGDVKITCDKELFGVKPGDALNKYMTVYADCDCLPIGVENPRMLYNYGDELPSNLEQFFVKETWIRTKYLLSFPEEPSERYEELTLYISFPMLIEHARDMAVAAYKGTELKEKYTEVVYTSECTIRFN